MRAPVNLFDLQVLDATLRTKDVAGTNRIAIVVEELGLKLTPRNMARVLRSTSKLVALGKQVRDARAGATDVIVVGADAEGRPRRMHTHVRYRS